MFVARSPLRFLPRSLPPFRNDDKVDLFAFIKPTYDVGGDFYSMLALDDDRLFFAIGDVADKGIPAALFMARLYRKPGAVPEVRPMTPLREGPVPLLPSTE